MKLLLDAKLACFNSTAPFREPRDAVRDGILEPVPLLFSREGKKETLNLGRAGVKETANVEWCWIPSMMMMMMMMMMMIACLLPRLPPFFSIFEPKILLFSTSSPFGCLIQERFTQAAATHQVEAARSRLLQKRPCAVAGT